MTNETRMQRIMGWKKKPMWWADGMGGSPDSKHMVWNQNGVRKRLSSRRLKEHNELPN